VLVLFAVLGSTACGSGSTPPLDARGIAQAADATARVSSARTGFVMELTLPDGEIVSVTGTGDYDTRAKKYSASFDLSALGSLLDSLLPYDTPASKLLENAKLWKLDAVQNGLELYLRYPILEKSRGWPKGKSWVRIDYRNQGLKRRTLQRIERYGASEPRGMLPCLEALVGKVERVGKEHLPGASVVHYQATIDVQKYRRLERHTSALARTSTPSVLLSQAHVRRVPVDVWIDGDGLVREFQLTFPSKNPDTQGPVQASIRFELYDFGSKVAIPVPPEKAVVDSENVAV
jgi:hypothetical protein